MCPPEDIELMYTQRRPGSFFNNELAGVQLTNESYGSIDRYYIVTGDDLATYPEFQLQMIANYPVKEVKKTERSGHEVMLSKPLELSAYILDFARQYPSYSANDAKDTAWVEMRAKLNSIRRGAWWA
ncbi:putative methylesterase 19 [Macadamia integrifolia]|uniref:putative methylesterase 19 n=1 Tax=Macadamia integrifolia TaxID=60698 RepID=UPI001C4E5B06|nr:putative methylesterase 19 [Macadamia integrifolia]